MNQIEQLSKLNDLLKNGAISQSEYETLKGEIGNKNQLYHNKQIDGSIIINKNKLVWIIAISFLIIVTVFFFLINFKDNPTIKDNLATEDSLAIKDSLANYKVSPEIVNSYHKIDMSLAESNKCIDNYITEIIYQSSTEPQKQLQSRDLKLIIIQLHDVTNQLIKEIEGLKLKLKIESGLGKLGRNERGDEQFREDDFLAVKKIFFEHSDYNNQNVLILFEKLSEYREKLLSYPDTKKTFAYSLLLIDKEYIDNFRKLPTIAALTMLSKIQNDILISEQIVIDFLCRRLQ
jgi:hypothetical protein